MRPLTEEEADRLIGWALVGALAGLLLVTTLVILGLL